MQADSVPFYEILQFTAVLLIVIVWIVTAPKLNSPWMPCSHFSRLAVFVLVFLFFWDRFIAYTTIMGEPLYLWYGMILILGIFAHWARISREEPTKRSG